MDQTLEGHTWSNAADRDLRLALAKIVNHPKRLPRLWPCCLLISASLLILTPAWDPTLSVTAQGDPPLPHQRSHSAFTLYEWVLALLTAWRWSLLSDHTLCWTLAVPSVMAERSELG